MASLPEITRDSDLVIRGAIRDAYSDWRGGDAYDSYVKVSIEEVLKGVPESREAGTVDVGIGYLSSDIDEPRSSLPAHDHLWFLVLAENGRTYYTADYVQVSVLREIDGVVQVIMPEAIANAFSRRHYPVPLDGTSFEELVEDVRHLVEGPSAAVQMLAARWSPQSKPDPNRFAAC